MFVSVVLYLCKSTAMPQTGDNCSGCKTNVLPIHRTQVVFAVIVSACVVWCSDGRAMYVWCCQCSVLCSKGEC